MDADQINAEMLAHRGSIASLDRTQLPPLSSNDQFVVNALHGMWVARLGEQTTLKGTGVGAAQWMGATSRNYSGQSLNCNGAVPDLSLVGHKGGMTYVEWSGTAFASALASMSWEPTKPDLMDKHLSLRIVINGIVVAESTGVMQGTESFRIFGNAVLPPGDLRVELQAVGQLEGTDGPLSTTASNTIMLYHVVNSSFFALARYR
ncbi:MAG: hypothetical protein GY872_06565 [Roseibacillus sp.]|nr:hypothetical protein [Roseibacillus sp.]